MKKLMKFFSAVLLGVLVMTAAGTVMAANDPYTYTVRIFPGNNGTADSGDCIKWEGIGAGTRITIAYTDKTISLNGQTITLNNDKYFIQGVRESGADALATVSFTVNRDMDFVASYGMRATAVEYTVRYVVQGTGQVLGTSTYYGNVGDKPVNAAEHFDGFRPLYRNITGTLHDPAESPNVWDLPYAVSDANTVIETVVEETTPAPGGTTPGGTTPGGETTPGETTPGETTPGETTPGETTPGEEPTPVEPTPAPEETIDIDNVPLPGPTEEPEPTTAPEPTTEPDKKSGLPTGAKAAIIAFAAAAAAAVIGVGVKRRNK